MLTEKLFNYEETQLLEELILTAIENGNRVELKAFDPTPDQYKMLFKLRKKIATMEIDVKE